MNRLCIVILSAALLGCGGSQHENEKIVRRPGNPPVHRVEDEDAAMNDAILRARASVQEFVTVLNSPLSTQTMFSVKAPFLVKGDDKEHIWLTDISHGNGLFHGKVGNEPLSTKAVRYGQHVSIPEAEISDWMYVEDGVLRGGHTIRALHQSLAGKEKAEFESRLPFRFE